MLWSGEPFQQRFERLSATPLTAAELWWPGADDARRLPALASRWGIRIVLLNFDAGDPAAGKRGLAADPAQRGYLREHIPQALRIAAECGCPRLNLLLGVRDGRYSLRQQMDCARDNVAFAADLAADAGCEITIEATNPADHGPVLLCTTADAASFIISTGRANVRLQYDVYHMQRTEGDLTQTIDEHWDLIGHIQIADVPGRHEPGTGEINYPFLLDHIAGQGYTGAIGLEYQPSTARPEDSLSWLERYLAVRPSPATGRGPSPG